MASRSRHVKTQRCPRSAEWHLTDLRDGRYGDRVVTIDFQPAFQDTNGRTLPGFIHDLIYTDQKAVEKYAAGVEQAADRGRPRRAPPRVRGTRPSA